MVKYLKVINYSGCFCFFCIVFVYAFKRYYPNELVKNEGVSEFFKIYLVKLHLIISLIHMNFQSFDSPILEKVDKAVRLF